MTVYTVGHSTRSLPELVAMLRAHGVELLVDVRRFPGSREATAAVMCAEALPERCHRRLLSDWLTVRGVEVVHILDERRTRPHRLPDFARVEAERLVYDGGQMELLPPLPRPRPPAPRTVGVDQLSRRVPMGIDRWGLYRRMLRSRVFEEAVVSLWHEGSVPGEMHCGLGEEGVVAGVVDHLRDGDALALDHRGTPPLLMRGVDPVALLREILGRPDGLCRGMGGHMHLFAPELLAASSGIVGASGPAGAAAPPSSTPGASTWRATSWATRCCASSGARWPRWRSSPGPYCAPWVGPGAAASASAPGASGPSWARWPTGTAAGPATSTIPWRWPAAPSGPRGTAPRSAWRSWRTRCCRTRAGSSRRLSGWWTTDPDHHSEVGSVQSRLDETGVTTGRGP